VKKPPEYFENRRREAAEKKKKDHESRLLVQRESRLVAAMESEIKRKTYRKEYNKKKRKEQRAEPFARRVEKNNVKHAALGKLSKHIVKELLIAQKCECVYCKVDITEERHIDHIFPIAKGGTNTDDNIQLTCPKCNIMKGDMYPWEFSLIIQNINAI
jgi:5-methylcytosine-specific restriction endonuclease McrA